MSAVRLRPGVLAQLRRAAGLSQSEVARRLEGCVPGSGVTRVLDLVRDRVGHGRWRAIA